MKWILYGHGGSGNHGCEAIIRSVLKIIGKTDISLSAELMSINPSEDIRYGVDKIISVQSATKNKFAKLSREFIIAYLKMKLLRQYQHLDALPYLSLIDKTDATQVALSVGGDNYCYGDTSSYAYLNRMYNKHGIRTVMVGCSIEPHIVNNPKVTKDLQNYTYIIARESITYDALVNAGVNRCCLLPDPAFQLDRIDLPLPEGFIEGNTVGVNMSHVVEECADSNIAVKNYSRLIDHIISTTTMQVALIPHVVWEGRDDRETMQRLYEKYAVTGRVIMIDDCNCMELKGFIARCRFMIAARTHASIAAYSTCVPTLVVGYSVKAKGIAKDIFGAYDNYVISAQSLSQENELARAFDWIVQREDNIRNHLNAIMPKYCERALLIGEVLENQIR